MSYLMRFQRAVSRPALAAHMRANSSVGTHPLSLQRTPAAAIAAFHSRPPHVPTIRRVERSSTHTQPTSTSAPLYAWTHMHSFYTSMMARFSSTSSSSSSSQLPAAGEADKFDDTAAIPLPPHPDGGASASDPSHLLAPTDALAVPGGISGSTSLAVSTSSPAPSSSPSAESATRSSVAPEVAMAAAASGAAPSHEAVLAATEAEAAKARSHAEVEKATFAPIPTASPDAELKTLRGNKQGEPEEDPSESIPKLPSSDTLIRGTLWFDNMYPMRVHWLDLRYLIATHNHDVVIPKLFAKAFGMNGFRLLGANPRANEGGVFVHFEVQRSEHVQTPEDVTKEIITLLRAKPVHAWLTPKAVRCHLVRGTPFLDDMASRFPYNRLKIEVRGPATALSDLTLEQLYNELNQFGKIFDLTLGPFEKDKSRQAVVQYVRMFSAVGARNCLHRLRLSVPLAVGSLPATVPPKVDSDGSSIGASFIRSKLPPPPTADAFIFLSYDNILKTSYLTDFASKHPRIAVPLLGLLFAALTYLIFDPLRSWNITNYITQRLALHELYDKLPWPFSWLRQQAADFSNSSLFTALRRGAGLGDNSSSAAPPTSWSAREADEEKVSKWLNSKPDRILFLTGPKGAGKQALVKKLTAKRKNVVVIDVSHIIDRADDEFVKALAASVGFAPGFALLTWISNIMDVFTPGASKASGSSTATSTQILKILECTSDALVAIARKENKARLKMQQKKLASMPLQQQEEEAAKIEAVDAEAVKRATGQGSAAASAMDADAAAAKKKQTEEEQKAPQEAQKVQQSATAQAVGSLLKMTGGFAPAPPATSASATATAPSASTASSNSSPSPAAASGAPANNTFEPLNKEPVVPGSPAHVSSESSPVRLNDKPTATAALRSYNSSRNEAETTEQQRNYAQYMQLQQEANHAAAAASAASSSAAPSVKEGLVEPDPDNLPLFIIDGFNAENASKHSNFLNVLVAWSSEMSAAGVARFAFLTDATLEESVSKALPDVKVAEVVLSDASPEAAQQFLFSSLPPHMRRAIPDQQTISALRILGGRYNDLMTLVRGVENGIHPIETVEEIVVQSMSTVKGMLFTEDKTVKWSKVQMWQVMSMLVASPQGTLLYDDVLFNVFSGDDTPLKSLVRADLLRVEPALSRGGDRLRAGSPVFLEAFRRLIHHQSKLKPGMDLLVVKYQIGVEQAKINAAEEELMRIAQTAEEIRGEQRLSEMQYAGFGRGRVEKGSRGSSSSSGVDASRLLQRQAFLVQLLHDSHTKVVGLDEKRRACEKEVKNIKQVD